MARTHWRNGDIRFWESETLDEHVALIKRQVDRSLEDRELPELVRRIVENDVSARGTLSAWGATFKVPREAPCNALDEPELSKLKLTRIWNFVARNWSYIEDPPGFDLFAHIEFGMNAQAHADRLASMKVPDAETRSMLDAHIHRLRGVTTPGAGDCFPQGTLLLRQDGQLVPVEALRAGDRIWGETAWSTVEAVWAKGVLPLTHIRLNSGSWLGLTDDHKVYVGACARHSHRVSSAPCNCPWSELTVQRVRVADLELGMRLCQPERIAFSESDGDPELAWVDGLYLADGWSEDYRFAISGKDGHPKEEQKRKVQEICTRRGIATRWHERYLAVNDPAWTERLAALGTRAPTKQARTLALNEAEAAELLRGVMADSGANTHGGGRTFTTTSRRLAAQVRVLHRMFARRTGFSFIENHGGLGTHPVYRITSNDRPDPTRAPKALRVRDILRSGVEAPVFDIQTSDHKVYLPEHDITVSNCDDGTIVLGTLLREAGFTNVRARVVSVDAQAYGHVYTMVGLPARRPTELVALDPTVKNAVPGWEYPGSKVIQDFEL